MRAPLTGPGSGDDTALNAGTGQLVWCSVKLTGVRYASAAVIVVKRLNADELRALRSYLPINMVKIGSGSIVQLLLKFWLDLAF